MQSTTVSIQIEIFNSKYHNSLTLTCNIDWISLELKCLARNARFTFDYCIAISWSLLDMCLLLLIDFNCIVISYLDWDFQTILRCLKFLIQCRSIHWVHLNISKHWSNWKSFFSSKISTFERLLFSLSPTLPRPKYRYLLYDSRWYRIVKEHCYEHEYCITAGVFLVHVRKYSTKGKSTQSRFECISMAWLHWNLSLHFPNCSEARGRNERWTKNTALWQHIFFMCNSIAFVNVFIMSTQFRVFFFLCRIFPCSLPAINC